jgi:hypothetical protein
MTISVDCIEAVSFTTYLNNEFGIKIAPYSNKCMINKIRVSKWFNGLIIIIK